MERQFLRETPGAVFEVLTDPKACEAVWDHFIDIHRRRWRYESFGSIFDSPRFARFYREAFLWAVRQGMAALFCLRYHESVLVAHTTFFTASGDTAYSHIIARDLTVSPPKCHSPGNLLNAMTVHWAITRAYRFLDLSFGVAPNKLDIGGQEIPSYELALARTPFTAMFIRQVRWQTLRLQRLPLGLRCFWRQAVERKWPGAK